MIKSVIFFAALFHLTMFCGIDSFAQQPQTAAPEAAPQPVVELQEQSPSVQSSPTDSNVIGQPQDGTAPSDTIAQNEEQKPLNVDNLFAPTSEIEKAISEQIKFVDPQINVNLMPSLLFSVWEHDLIVDARRGLNSGLSSSSIGSSTGQAIQDISLGGIVFKSPQNWTIWLNSTRVTPDAIPSEILDLEVTKDFIKVEWFDSSRNLIFPIKLRPHQRFNLDTRLFFSGQ